MCALSVRLKLTEIFYSLQGEAETAGIPTVFVRLTGCPLRCQYCDTAYAFHGGQWWQLADILERVGEFVGHPTDCVGIVVIVVVAVVERLGESRTKKDGSSRYL